MQNSLVAHINNKQPDADCLDYLLTRLISYYQNDFTKFADCGAGVGSATKRYLQLMNTHLEQSNIERISVVSYEPLPENVLELKKRVGSS